MIVQNPPEENRNYNCFVFAFDLQDHAPLLGGVGWEYTKELDIVVDVLINNKTLEKLITLQPEALIVYRTNKGIISHVGRITADERVISKWSWGPLLEHDLYAVPASYGNTLEYYTNVKEGKGAILKDFSNHY